MNKNAGQSHFETSLSNGLRLVTVLSCLMMLASAVCHAQLQEQNLYLKSTSTGHTELNLDQLQSFYTMNRELGIKNYLPQNITAKDDKSQVAQKFFSNALEKFAREQEKNFAATVKTMKTLNQTSSNGVAGTAVKFQTQILQGKAALVHSGYFETSLGYNVSKSTVLFQMTRFLQPHTRLTLSQSSDSEQTLSKMAIAYEF